MLYSVRSERQLMEQLDYNLLFRWFVGLSMDDRVWDPTVFTKNRERLLHGDIARAFFERVLAQAQARQLLSAEHFTVDGTLIEAWAGLKSFKKRGTGPTPPDDPGNPTVNFHGERRSNATHASTTDPEARLMRKGPGKEAKLVYHGHALMENRHGLVVDTCVTQAVGTAEREAAAAMATNLRRGATVGGDKGYDTRGFVAALRSLGLTPHVAQNTDAPAQCDRRPDHAPSRVCRQSAEAEARRRGVRLAQDGGPLPEDAPSRRAPGRVAVHAGGRAVQPGAHPEPDRGRGDRMSPAGARASSPASGPPLERELEAQPDQHRAAGAIQPGQHLRPRAQPARQETRAQPDALHQKGQAREHQPEHEHRQRGVRAPGSTNCGRNAK